MECNLNNKMLGFYKQKQWTEQVCGSSSRMRVFPSAPRSDSACSRPTRSRHIPAVLLPRVFTLCLSTSFGPQIWNRGFYRSRIFVFNTRSHSIVEAFTFFPSQNPLGPNERDWEFWECGWTWLLSQHGKLGVWRSPFLVFVVVIGS